MFFLEIYIAPLPVWCSIFTWKLDIREARFCDLGSVLTTEELNAYVFSHHNVSCLYLYMLINAKIKAFSMCIWVTVRLVRRCFPFG